MGFIETVSATVASALVVGLTVLAIKKPRQYRRLQPFLFILIGLVWVFTTAYAIGADVTEDAMIPFIDGEQRMAAFNAATVVQPNMGLLVVAAVFVGAFLGILRSLPQILGISDDGGEKDDGKDKPED